MVVVRGSGPRATGSGTGGSIVGVAGVLVQVAAVLIRVVAHPVRVGVLVEEGRLRHGTRKGMSYIDFI